MSKNEGGFGPRTCRMVVRVVVVFSRVAAYFMNSASYFNGGCWCFASPCFVLPFKGFPISKSNRPVFTRTHARLQRETQARRSHRGHACREETH